MCSFIDLFVRSTERKYRWDSYIGMAGARCMPMLYRERSACALSAHKNLHCMNCMQTKTQMQSAYFCPSAVPNENTPNALFGAFGREHLR